MSQFSQFYSAESHATRSEMCEYDGCSAPATFDLTIVVMWYISPAAATLRLCLPHAAEIAAELDSLTADDVAEVEESLR